MIRRLSLPSFAAIVAIAALGHADPTAADLVTARKLFNDALDLEDAGNLQGALAKLVAADALVATPRVRLELGKVHLKLGHLVDAHQAFTSIKSIPVDPKTEPKYAASRTEAAALAISTRERIPQLRVIVHGLQPGELTAVLVDDILVPIPAIAEPRLVDPGHHIIVVRATRGEERVEIDLAEKDDRTAAITFAPAPGPAPAPSLPPPAAPSAPSAPTASSPPKPPPADHPAPLPTLFWLSTTTAAAALVTGGITGAITLSRASTLRTQCDPKCPPEVEGQLTRARTLGTISTVSFVVAGVFTGVSIVSWATRPKEHPVTPVVGLGWLGVEGRF